MGGREKKEMSKTKTKRNGLPKQKETAGGWSAEIPLKNKIYYFSKNK